MRMSCNGCRVLRKGCTNNCVLKPCLQWLKSPQSQANATLFLAKFYGRVGLLNLLNAGPHHLRPAIFKSLLYEACGRIVQPVHGCAGLLIAGEWDRCQAAVDAVLEGSPIADHITPHAPASSHPVNPPLKTPFDSSSNPATPDDVILCNLALRKRCKRSPEPPTVASRFRYSYSSRTEGRNGEFNSGSSSHFSSPSDQGGEVGLELTLGRGSMPRAAMSSEPADLTNVREGGSGGYAYKTEEFMF